MINKFLKQKSLNCKINIISKILEYYKFPISTSTTGTKEKTRSINNIAYGEASLYNKRKFSTFGCHPEIDIFRDVGPFEAIGMEKNNIVSAYDREIRVPKVEEFELPVLIKPGVANIDFSSMFNGMALLDKKEGEQDHLIMQMMINAIRTKRIPITHASSLDILSSGLKFLLFGKAGKMKKHFEAMTQEYEGRMRIGMQTITYDLKTRPKTIEPWTHIKDEEVAEMAQNLIGEIRIPSIPYVAVRGRKNRLFRLKANVLAEESKAVIVEKFELNRWRKGDPFFDFSIKCSQSCAINVLIHELGQRLNCGAVLVDSRRIALGEFKVEDAVNLKDLWRFIFDMRKANRVEYGLNHRMAVNQAAKHGRNRKKKTIKLIANMNVDTVETLVRSINDA